MHTVLFRAFPFLLFLPFLLLSGCALKWESAVDSVQPASFDSTALSLKGEADACFERSATKAEIENCLGLYKEVLQKSPADYHSLVRASTLHILLGTAYTDNSFRKSDHFMLAMKYAELAMYTNQDFYQRILAGEKPWEAADALTRNELEAVFFWVTALQYEFKEGMSLPSKIVNIGWLERALVMLERIESLDPEFGGGGVEFAKVICYYALPSSRGGSKQTGDQLMQEAVKKGETWLLPRWARGKYYYEINGNEQEQKKDLEWVASRPLDSFEDPYPWRIHFQENARELLSE